MKTRIRKSKATKLLQISRKIDFYQGLVAAKKLIQIVAVLLLAFYISHNWFQLMLIQGDSMIPSYHSMQLVILDKRGGPYRTGDVIAFWCDGVYAVLVKRIAAVPGESVVIQEGTLFVDQKASGLYDYGTFSSSGMLHEMQSLSCGEYIVIGDNLDESKDSRDYRVGIVHDDDIIGRIFTLADIASNNQR